jgi:hypothetical protein
MMPTQVDPWKRPVAVERRHRSYGLIGNVKNLTVENELNFLDGGCTAGVRHLRKEEIPAAYGTATRFSRGRLVAASHQQDEKGGRKCTMPHGGPPNGNREPGTGAGHEADALNPRAAPRRSSLAPALPVGWTVYSHRRLTIPSSAASAASPLQRVVRLHSDAATVLRRLKKSRGGTTSATDRRPSGSSPDAYLPAAGGAPRE